MKQKLFLSSIVIFLATLITYHWLIAERSWQELMKIAGSGLISGLMLATLEYLLGARILYRVVRISLQITLPKYVARNTRGTDGRRPPKFAEYLLYFLPKKDRETLLGDLEEEYRGIYKKFGRRKATFWYYCQVVMSFWPYLANTIKKLLGWGVVGWVGSAIRRLIG